MFSGLNLALLGGSQLRLEIEAESGNSDAIAVLGLRKNVNRLLTTILWGNVAVNTLLALLMESLATGAIAFAASTVCITFFGEIVPQAYFSRHALRVGALLAPIVRLYMVILWPVAAPSAKLLDWWLGEQGVSWFREEALQQVLRRHAEDDETEVDRTEAIGAINFLDLDDIPVVLEGNAIHPESIIRLPVYLDTPEMPEFACTPDDPFLNRVHASGKAWVVLCDEEDDEPFLVLDADGFLREALIGGEISRKRAYDFAHRPLVVRDPNRKLGDILSRFEIEAPIVEDDVIDDDVVLVWTEDERRIITGADVLGRLLRGIAQHSADETVRADDDGIERSGPKDDVIDERA